MSEFPALRDALVGAATRRRRRRRVVSAALPVLAVVVAVGALAVVSRPRPEREQAVPAPHGKITDGYGVFRL